MILPLLLASLFAATETNTAPQNPGTAKPDPAALLHQISPGIYDYKGIRLDKPSHSISFPAKINQREGFIEYLLVNEKGKTHESLFSTALLPHDIHVAMLLIGLEQNPAENMEEKAPPQAIDEGYLHSAPKIKGLPILVSVTWNKDGKPAKVAAEDWIFDLQTHLPMSSGPWTYNGSMIENGVFLADSELSLISVITDPTALVNNPRPGYDNDEIWEVRDEEVPPLDTPVEITLTLSSSAKP
ncbi:MAG: YdjY domain-containing protein [Methylacidiphilales bacterium]|nr:YdjY domain-containing protein [Candidatus Methylacidiphilales bacterium]